MATRIMSILRNYIDSELGETAGPAYYAGRAGRKMHWCVGKSDKLKDARVTGTDYWTCTDEIGIFRPDRQAMVLFLEGSDDGD